MKKHKAILFPFIKLSFNQYKPYFFVLIGTCLLRAGQAVFGAYTLSLLIKALEANDKNKALIAGCVLVGVEVILAFLVKLFNRLLTISKAKMEEAISQMISKKILSVPFSYLEDPYYMEIKKDAEQGINNMGAIYLLLDSFAQALSSILTIISLSVILITFDPLLIVVLIVGIILMIIMVVISLKTQVTFFKDLLPLNYKYSYYIGTLLEPKNNKELRLYPVYDIMSGNFCSYGKTLLVF